MYGLEQRAWRPGEVITADGNKVYNLQKNTRYRIAVYTADVWMKLGSDRAALAGTAATTGDILLPVGVHFVDVGPREFMSISTPANANVLELERI